MNATTGQAAMAAVSERTIRTSKLDHAYHARESEGYFRTGSQQEAVVRFVGIVIILGAFIQWLMPDDTPDFQTMMTKVGLSVAFALIGIALYTFALRGHRQEITLDPITRQLTIARLDRRNNVRSTRRFPLSAIKSIYVRKGEGLGAPSKMRLRLRDQHEEITALRGRYEDIELMHRALCRSIRMIEG